VKSFVWDGLIVDGVWGTIKGLGTLVGFGGWDAMGQAWKGLAQLATGLVITAIPGANAQFWTLPDDKLPSWLRDSRTAMKETGKALVAWDQWGKNPARAAGAVTFNVLTTVFTGGAGGAAAGAGKAGAVAKALSVAGKAGRVIDPMTYIAKGAGAGLSKIGDITKGLKGAGTIDIPKLPENAVTLPEGTVMLADGTVHLPEGAALPKGATKLPDGNVRLPDDAPVLPEGTTRLPTPEGAPARYYDPDGNLLDEHGNVLQKSTDGPGDVVDQPGTPDTPGTPASGADTPRVPAPAREPALVGAGTHTAEQAGQHIRLGDSLENNLGDVGRVDEDVPTTPAVHADSDVPNGHAGGDMPPGSNLGDALPDGNTGHFPGGGVGDNMPTNSVEPHVPAGAGDHAVPGTTAGDHLSGGHADGVSTPGRDLPGDGSASPLPSHAAELPTGGSGLDGLGRAGDNTLGTTGGSGDVPSVSGHPSPPERPSFMRDGDNPYGPEGSLTREQIQEIQVYRANQEPGYFEDFYKSNGNRKNLEFLDESGTTPPQLTRESPRHPWVTVKDAPEPLKPHYLGDATKVGRETASPEALKLLDEAAASRHHAIAYDQAAGRHKAEAVEAHKHGPTPETELTRLERTNEYRSAHTDMRDSAEAYGEAIAEHHVVPERYPGATRETLHGPLNGNDQFDQVWKREDGGYVVIEAKSSIETDLGARNLPSGKRVSQGTREYFLDIIQEMKKRGETIPSERRLARQLEDALDEGKLDYLVVKGQKNAGTYNGYSMREFDITERNAP
ncbi:hypothetical protein, partial [Streptomyces azureus]